MEIFRKIPYLIKKTKEYIFNTGWIVFEKIFISGFSFLVTIVLARYLGAEQLGIITYSLSLVTIISIAGHLGLSALVVREIVKSPSNKDLILGSTFLLKFFGYLSGFILLVVFAYLSEDKGDIKFWILVIFASSILFRAFDVIDYVFQSKLNAKYGSISRIFSSIFGNLIKVITIVTGSTLVYFAFGHVIQALVCALIFIYLYKSKLKETIFSWRVSKSQIYKLASDGSIVFLGTIFWVIYLKIDQFMLRWMLGLEEVGIYSVAASISETWYFIPTAIMISFFPKLIELSNKKNSLYKLRLQQLIDMVFIIALIIAILITLLADEIILFLFGDPFIQSANVLIIHIWASLFIFMRAVFSKWVLIENMLVFSVVTEGLGTISNILLNLWFIPNFGLTGAAFASLISYAIASYFSLLLHPRSRIVFIMMSKAMFSPFRYLIPKKFSN